MDSSIVIKVKYGEILRRFNARVNEAGQLDLDIGGLRNKVIGLFNFFLEADLTFTYIDEDGDVVALVDEEDLCDVVRQSLNPLRITVKLKAEKGGKSYARSSGNSPPMRSPRVQYPLPNLNDSVSEYLLSVPEPLRATLSKIAVDLVSKAVSSSSVLVELVDCFSKMGLSRVSPVSEFQTGTESSTQSVASGSTMGALMTNKVTEASRDDGPTLEVFPNVKVQESAPKAIQKVDGVNSTRCLGSLNLNDELPDDSSLSGNVSEILGPAASDSGVGDREEWFKKYVDLCLSDNDKDVKKSGEGLNSVSTGAFCSTAGSMGHSVMDTTANLGGSVEAKLPSVHPFKRSYTHSDGMSSVFHRGVQCDVCGVHPIAGPRYKSKVKEDYDLCSVCFSEMGKEADYIRIDRPASSRPPHSFKGLWNPQPRAHHPMLPEVKRGFEMQPRQLMLDSRFIVDVNVMDGTLMAPSTPFTKIWRLRNSGTIVWPRGTQLLWIGGDKFSASLSIDLQISADGIPMENELDVAADFTAPDLPGRYISYWRMAAPSGQKFGQRVWVLIQVDASMENSSHSFQGLNLNLPPQESDDITDPEIINVNGTVQPLVDAHPYKNQELDFLTNDTLLVGGAGGVVSNTVSSVTRTSVSFPITQITSAMPSGTHVSSPSTVVPETIQGTSKSNDVEQSLLRDLEEMGFNQADLNKEVLRLNEYNFEQSLDDLCGIAEWDPILEELQEMGFCDKEMNMKLLMKNNGSIKRVVMDLITGDKA